MRGLWEKQTALKFCKTISSKSSFSKTKYRSDDEVSLVEDKQISMAADVKDVRELKLQMKWHTEGNKPLVIRHGCHQKISHLT